MDNPFNILNAEAPAVPSLTPEDRDNVTPPQPAPPPPFPKSASAPQVSNGVFDGAGAFDMEAGAPPDIGREARRLPWQKGTSIAQAPPASLDRFCCLNGPCKHYSEIHVDEPGTFPEATVRVVRLCRKHLDDDGGSLELSEGTVPACLTYEPPWWSISGWRMKLIVARRLDMALHKISNVAESPLWKQLVKLGILPEESNYGRK